ncbi:cytidine deaminase [Oxalobacteraceae bacterium]|nr:cytidine deaminase [Oxalobacteraceae bacterium]
MDFYGKFEDLKSLLNGHGYGDEWVEKNDNLIQLRTVKKVLVNWHPKNNNISVQGKYEPAQLVRQAIRASNALAAANVVGPNVDKNTEPRIQYIPLKPEVFQAEEEEYKTDYDSELVIGLVGAVGTNLAVITEIISERLKTFGYLCDEIKISNDIITPIAKIKSNSYYERTDKLMTEGNNLRKNTGDYGFLAKVASGKINAYRAERGAERKTTPMPRRAFIVSSLKHPEEVAALRKIYSGGFYLLGVYSLESRRQEYLEKKKRVSEEEGKRLIARDADEKDKFGQHTRDTYHLSDFFVDFGPNSDKFEKDVWRFLDLIFGRPFVTPTFDEYAMFMAFSASLRSADLSRQVGAVVTKDCAIVATGANDVPKFGGGLYWPEYNSDGTEISDRKEGRDYRRKGDTNVLVKNEIIEDILLRVSLEQRDALRVVLLESKLKDITEYGRIVHAEMEALLSCSRGNIGTQNAHIYCTTFPCHNCAKHMIAAGIERVVYVEPYPKSKALDFHEDSITLQGEEGKLRFEPFVGVGPRSFFNLFSVNLGSGYSIVRKTNDGKPSEWSEDGARLRMQMLPSSYIEREAATTYYVQQHLEKLNEKPD